MLTIILTKHENTLLSQLIFIIMASNLSPTNSLEIGYNPTFEDSDLAMTSMSIEYEMRIKQLEEQLEQKNKLCSEVQDALLQSNEDVTNTCVTQKRTYAKSKQATVKREFVSRYMNNKDILKDLVNGVGLETINAKNVPKSLLRAYINFRYSLDLKDDSL